MPSPFRRSLPIAGAAAIVTTALALTETPVSAAPCVRLETHVRAETTEARALIEDLIARSPTARALVAGLNGTDVVVYVRHRTFTQTTLDGRIGFVHSTVPTPRLRYLIVEIACGRSYHTQLVALGHELRHAAEIAAAPQVVSAQTLATHYRRIGMRTGLPNAETFETEAAQETSTRVRRELFDAAATRVTHDRD